MTQSFSKKKGSILGMDLKLISHENASPANIVNEY